MRAAGVDRSPVLALGSGDDAAITVIGERASALSVDAFVDGIHFRRETATPQQIGHKALAASLSDLAAMGAEPGEAYAVLGVPQDVDERGCLEILDGMITAAKRWRTALAGGDVVRAPALLVAMTVVGYAESDAEMVTRGGTGPGEAVAVTGELGGAAAGLLLIDRPELADSVPAEIAAELRARHLEPSPRLAAGRILARSGASAMIDISDGLAGDAAHVASASAVRVELDVPELPLADGVAEVAAAAGFEPAELALGGGEDYELLACLAPEALDRARAELEASGDRITPIGAVANGAGVELRGAGAAAGRAEGFDHFR